MSKARLVITAVTVEKRPVSEVARAYGVARSWVYTLLARYRAEGEAAFEPRPRRPKASPAAIGDATVGLIIELRKDLSGQGLDAGPDTIAWHLARRHQVPGVTEQQDKQVPRPGFGGQVVKLRMGKEDVVTTLRPGQAQAMCRVRTNAASAYSMVERGGHDEHRLPYARRAKAAERQPRDPLREPLIGNPGQRHSAPGRKDMQG